MPLHRMAVDGGKLLVGEGEMCKRAHILEDLLSTARPDEDTGHLLPPQAPGEGHLGETLSP